MGNNSSYKQNILNIFGEELGKSILALIDPCSTDIDCSVYKTCETLTSLTIDKTDPTNVIITYSDEAGINTVATLPINPAISTLSYDTNTEILTATLTNGSTVTVSIPNFVFNEQDGIATIATYDGVTGNFTVDLKLSTDTGNAAIIGTDGGLYVPPVDLEISPNSGIRPIHRSVRTFTAAEIQDLHNTQITLTASFGPNILVRQIDGYYDYDYNGTAYTSGGSPALTIECGTINWTCNIVLNPTAGGYQFTVGTTFVGAIDAPIRTVLNTSAISGAGGNVTVYVYYTLLDMSTGKYI